VGWAFYLDVDVTVPASAWPAIEAATPASQAIAAGWWGFADAALEAVFTSPDCDGMTAGSALAAFAHAQGVCRIERGKDVHVRLCTLLDERGEPYLAKPIAALVDAACGHGRGHVALVNEQGGVRVTLAGNALARERIAEPVALAEQLATLVYGTFVDDAVEATAPKSKKRKKS
jgi:hypothetical protein